MALRLRSLLLYLLIFTLLHSYTFAESEKEIYQKNRTAPDKILERAVIDGSGISLHSSQGSSQGFDEGEVGRSRVSVCTVAWLTLAMAAATGLGAIPFFFVELEPQWAGVCNGLAAGVILAASFDLVHEGQTYGSGNWVMSGAIFIWLCKKPIVAVPSFLFADAFHKVLPFCTGFAAGCMIWMVIAEVLPDAFKEASSSLVASAGTLAVAFMETLSTVLQILSNYNSVDASGFSVSLLFSLGPLLGGIILVSFALSFLLPHALLTGVACGIAFMLAAWRPLQLLFSFKIGFSHPLIAPHRWLCLLPSIHIWHPKACR